MAAAWSSFAGFSPDAVDFLAELAENNDREWFTPRKATTNGGSSGRWKHSSSHWRGGSPPATSRFAKDKSPHYDKVHTGNARRLRG